MRVYLRFLRVFLFTNNEFFYHNVWKTMYCSSTTHGSFLLTTILSTIVYGMICGWWYSCVATHHFCLAQPHLFFIYKVYTTYSSFLLRTLVLSFVVNFLYTN